MSQPFSELFDIDFDVAENFPHQTRTDVFSLVDGNGRAAAIRMFKLPMASPGLSQQPEPHFFQGANEFARLDVRQVGAAHTVTST